MNHEHVAVVGLGFGDESKGATVDYLAASGGYDCVVRFNGGSQAAHHVVHEPTGKVHRFSQFGSGTFRKLPTILSQFMMVDPLRLANEAKALHHQFGIQHPLDLISIHPRALVTTPLHAYANRAAEVTRGDEAHGSCGVGVGETMRQSIANKKRPYCANPSDYYDDYSLRMGDFRHMDVVAEKLKFLWNCYNIHRAFGPFADEVPSVDDLVEAYRWVADDLEITRYDAHDAVYRTSRCIFEGSQGVLLDEWYGFHPHTTWSTTTFTNVTRLLAGTNSTAYRLGVLRSYTTRHGAGPFPTETDEMTSAHPEAHNGTGVYQGAWRAGHFDAVLHRYAIDVCGHVDGLAVNHLDREVDRFCIAYDMDGLYVSALRKSDQPEDLSIQERMGKRLTEVAPYNMHPFGRPAGDVIAELLEVPVVIEGYGPSASDRKGMLP